MNKENINLKDYGYLDNQEIEIKIQGKLLETILDVLDTIQKTETHYGISDTYSTKTKEVFVKTDDGNKVLTKVEQELKEYTTMQSYATQPFQVFKTQLGAVAMEMLMAFKEVHLKNIENGVAKKLGVFEMQPTVQA